MSDHFERLCQWFESEMVPVKTSEIHSKMKELAKSDEVYSLKHLKRKLEERYKEDIIISQTEGKANLVCFKDVAQFIIKRSKKENENTNEEVIIKTAAKLIKAEIQNQKFNTEIYPSRRDIENHTDSLAPLLQNFMKELVCDELKQSSIGQAIMKAVKIRFYIPPLLFGLGVELDHKFGSKWLTNEVYKLGFSISPSEIARFKQSVIANKDSSIEVMLKGSFGQWVADNVDHDVCTLDGKDTFHGMGIIAAGMINQVDSANDVHIRREKYGKKAADVTSKAKIPILWYEAPDRAALSNILFKPVSNLQSPHTFSMSHGMDLLWQFSFSSTAHENRMNWNGFMQVYHDGRSHPGKRQIFMLPIIDLSSSDESCIYSTLVFIMNQAKAIGIDTPSVTFDQPLWLKAYEISKSKVLNIVIRLGGFHTLMSFLESIGAVMYGAGLSQLLELVYAKNSVKHIISGKAVSRALRGHFLVESALMGLLFEKMVEDGFDTASLEKMYQHLVQGEASLTDVNHNNCIIAISKIMENFKAELSSKSRTAKLWIQYLEYINIIKVFIRAERTGNWHAHLEAMRLMLNLFAATGHVNYAKSARLYLQSMQSLHVDHPWLYNQYCKSGYHCIRRSDRFWAGLWPDLVIEQCMMRAIKSSGGLTRGRGMTESTRNLWVGTLHECASIHESMAKLTKHRFESSQQHCESGEARRKRDGTDVEALKDQLKQHNPFDCQDSRLQCIFTGMAADLNDEVNCDQAETVGFEIQNSLNDVVVSKASIKRSKQVKTLATLLPAVKINGDPVYVDPNILFQRLIMLIDRSEEMTTCFEYELTPEQTSLFKDGLMRKPNKALLGRRS